MVHKWKRSQEIQFSIMRNASFNKFDGDKVVELLKNKPDLWEGVVMTSGVTCYKGNLWSDLIHLRDIDQGFTNIDTVFIKAKRGQEAKLENFVKNNFKADEIRWLGKEEKSKRMGGLVENNVLRVWWD